MKNNNGFTLLEVLVSLAILTISLTAMVSVTSQRADTLIELRDKNNALELAHSVLNDFYQQSVQSGKKTGKNNDWYWQVDVVSTNNEYIWRLDVSVSKSPRFEYAQAKLTGFKWR